MSAPAAPVKKNEKVIICTNQNKPGKGVTLRVSTNANASAAAPVSTSATIVNAQAEQKAKVNDIVTRIVYSAKIATADNIVPFNTLLAEYNTERAKIDPKADNAIVPINTELTEGAIKTAMDDAVRAVQASAPKAGGGRRKTHRKKHSMRSKRHCKTHKKHGGKRSTKHHKKHGKTRGKRSKTHKKRHHKKH